MIPSAPLAPGTLVGGDFRVLRPLARGGMGMLYVVQQVSVGAERALKVMHGRMAADARLRERFLLEARASARIESDHVVQVIAAGIDDATGTPWMVQELLRGEDLSAFMARRGTLDFAETLEIFRQLCHALGMAHRAGLVHRDLKPDNIFLAIPRRDGSPFTVKLLDFGIAKLLEESATGSTPTTTALGSPLWMAPEQAQKGHVSPATDVWALGLVGFFLLTGYTFWFAGNREDGNVQQVLREIFVDPLAVASVRAAAVGAEGKLPPGFDGWFARCVDRDASRRYRDATEALAGLTAVLVSAGATPFTSITPPPVQGMSTVVTPAAIDPVLSPAPLEALAIQPISGATHRSVPPPPTVLSTPPVAPSRPPTNQWIPETPPASLVEPKPWPASMQPPMSTMPGSAPYAPSWPVQPQAPQRRSAAWVVIPVLLLLLCGGAGGVWLLWPADNHPIPAPPRPPVVPPPAATLAAGASHTCELGPGGTISCWGQNRYGQLGDRSTRDRHRPGIVAGIVGAVEVSSGYAHTCARMGNGSVRCWGSNASGQLGDGTLISRDTATVVAGLPPVAEIKLGEAHSCATTVTGAVWCWGRNEHGQLGTGDTRGRLTPTLVQGIDGVVDLALGSTHTCALRADASVGCWGGNEQGQLGVGSLQELAHPTAVAGLSDVTTIAAGGQRTCATLHGGAVRCWGRNDVGQLGDGTTAGRSEPVPVVGLESPVVAVSVAPLHTCARMTDRSVRCWGDNAEGELGDGSPTQRLVPTRVLGLTTVTDLVVTVGHGCVRIADGTVRCWGHNADGELGDGTTTPRLVPTALEMR